MGPVSGASVLTHLLSARKQFSTLGAGNLLLVRPVLANSLKREEVIIGARKDVFMIVLW